MSFQLVSSPVEFNEELHRYSLGEKRLLGITGLIHEILELGVYPDASEFVKNTAIPRAGEYGSSVHKAIETYDEIGIKATIYPNSFGPEPWDVSQELENYIRNRVGFRPLANEYTVSDNEKWASNIDNVWVREQTGGIWLVDTKTNNLNYYPLDGYGQPNYFADHAEGLKEYLSWQLSIYAEMFEAQNPGLKVEGLACNWLRKSESAYWVIERKPSAMVQLLLLTAYHFDENGVAHYSHPNPAPLKGKAANAPAPQQSIIDPSMITYISTLMQIEKETKAKLDEAKANLRATMEQHNIRSWDSGLFRATIAADSERPTFDTARFKADHPDLYEQYITRKPTKGGFTLK